MVKTNASSKKIDPDELVALLLVVAGSWFVLSKALEAANRAQGQQPRSGEEWARGVLKEIDKVREASDRDVEHSK